MTHYFVWNSTKCPDDRKDEIQDHIRAGVSNCIAGHQTVPDQLRIEVSDGPISLYGEVTTSEQKTIVRFTYSLLQGGTTTYQFFG